MDWAGAIERNSEALKAILAALFAMLALEGGTRAARLPRALHTAILSILRPAESAVRRLIIVAARGLVAKPHVPRPKPSARIARKAGHTRVAFPLIDPRKNFAPRRRAGKRVVPRIHFFAFDPRVPVLWNTSPPAAEPAPADGRVDAGRLLRRLEAVKLALGDLPRQAKRLARLRAKQAAAHPFKPVKPPMRPGNPPGHRAVLYQDIDRVLAECHALARDAMVPDT